MVVRGHCLTLPSTGCKVAGSDLSAETTVPVLKDRKGASFKVTENLGNVENLEW